jgi:hypothetical protein
MMSTAPLTYDNWLRTKHQLDDLMLVLGGVIAVHAFIPLCSRECLAILSL